MRSIGETARASGLSVSALRFYDSAGVLVPALVDPVNGYRWYTDPQVDQARLVAGLRRVGMPVAEIAAVLGADPATAHRLVDRHLGRLETGLADARRELSRVHALLDTQENPMTTVTLSAAVLAAAFDSVRFAASADPELPMLAGVLVDAEPGAVTFVATDRFRMAIHRESAEVDGPASKLIAPTGWVDRLKDRLQESGDEPVTLRLDGTLIEAQGADWTIKDTALAYDYPDYRRLVEARTGDSPRSAPVDPVALRAALAAPTTPRVIRQHDGVDHELAVLAIGAGGGVDLVGEEEWNDEHVAVNRGFLLEALNAGGDGQLVLELDGPIHPLAIRRTADDRGFSIIMPVKA